MQDAYRLDITQDSRLYVPAGEGKVAFLDVRDCAAVAAEVFSSPATYAGQALHMTGPAAITFHQAAQVLSQQLGRSISYVPASVPGYMWHLKKRRRLPLAAVAIQTFLHVGLRKGDAEAVADTTQRVLGRPAGSFEEYVSRSARAWQGQEQEQQQQKK